MFVTGNSKGFRRSVPGMRLQTKYMFLITNDNIIASGPAAAMRVGMGSNSLHCLSSCKFPEKSSLNRFLEEFLRMRHINCRIDQFLFTILSGIRVNSFQMRNGTLVPQQMILSGMYIRTMHAILNILFQ